VRFKKNLTIKKMIDYNYNLEKEDKKELKKYFYMAYWTFFGNNKAEELKKLKSFAKKFLIKLK